MEVTQDLTLNSLRINPSTDNASIMALDVEGPTTIDSTLAVTGATTLSSTLAVTGATTFTGAVSGGKRNVELVTADDTLTAAESGKLFVFNDVDGATLTLPDSGAGDIIGVYYDFYINVTATSNQHKVVCTDTTNEKLYGILRNSDTDTGDAALNFAALSGDNFSAISCNGTTTGIQGSSFRLTNIAADVWKAEGDILANGNVATSFAAS